MIDRYARSRRLLAGSALTVSILLITIVAPQNALAHWGACGTDPKVWLDNGTKVETTIAIQADRSVVSHVTMTLHVPNGVHVTRIQYTAGVDSSFETVNVVADSAAGYLIDGFAASTDGGSYPVALTVHLVQQTSTWSSAAGFTNQDVTTFVAGP